MVDETLVKIAAAFKAAWAKALSPFPKYRIDFSWPSVGLLDQITFPLRLKKTFDEQDRRVLLAVAAYLGGMVHDCWSRLSDDLEANLKLEEENEANVTLEIIKKGGPTNRPLFRISLTAALEKILLSPPAPFPVFEKLSRTLEADHNRISLFAIGLFSGICSHGEGVWTERTAEQSAERLQAIQVFLSYTAVSYYEAVFPLEERGADPLLYQSNLIMPPAEYDEPFPAVHAAAALVDYGKQFQLDETALAKLALNLALFPDELMSSAGAAVSAATVSDSTLTRTQLALSCVGSYLPRLRPAVMMARKRLGMAHDFVQSYESGDKESFRSLVAREKSLGLLPLLRLTAQTLEQENLIDVLKPLAWHDAKAARDIAEYRLVSDALNIESLLLQSAYLDLQLGDIENCDKKLKTIAYQIPPDASENRAFFSELCGLYQLHLGRTAEALQLFDTALRLHFSNASLEAAENYVECLLTLGRTQEVAATAAELLKRFPASIRIRTAYYAALRQLERLDEAETELRYLASHAPMNRRVFLLVIDKVLRQSAESLQ